MSDRLAEIRQRMEAATAGPWHQGSWSGRCRLPHRHNVTDCDYQYQLSSDGVWGRVVSAAMPIELIGWHEDGPVLNAKDAAFIAHSREDVAWLVAEVERLNAIIEKD